MPTLHPMGTPITPYGSGDAKKAQVAQMFDNIAHRYDFLNHFFSLGIDKLWRRKAVRMLLSDGPVEILDVATGTADFAIEAARKAPELKVIGVDISAGMLDIGRTKVTRADRTAVWSLFWEMASPSPSRTVDSTPSPWPSASATSRTSRRD